MYLVILLLSVIAQLLLFYCVKTRRLHVGYSPLIGTWVAHAFLMAAARLLKTPEIAHFFLVWGDLLVAHALLAIVGGLGLMIWINGAKKNAA
jgi:hypothetical protein